MQHTKIIRLITGFLTTELAYSYFFTRLCSFLLQFHRRDGLATWTYKYLLIGLTAFIISVFTTKSLVKKCYKSTKDIVRKSILILPLLATLIFSYFGFYSINNFTRIYLGVNQEFDNESLLEKYGSKDKIIEYVDEVKIQEKKEFIVSIIIYLSTTELGTFLIANNLDKLLLDDPKEET